MTAEDTLDAGDNVSVTLASLRDSSNDVPPSNPNLSAIFVTPAPNNPVTGTCTWTPGFLDAGTYTATFNATDGIDSAPPRTVHHRHQHQPQPDDHAQPERLPSRCSRGPGQLHATAADADADTH